MIIASSGTTIYARRTMLRFISAFLVALALFVSPLAMASGASMAMPHEAARAMADGTGHCAGNEAPFDDRSADVKMSCATACAAFPASAAITENQPKRPRVDAAIVAHRLPAGIQPEGETPPPRITPGI